MLPLIPKIQVRGLTISPPLLLAPMAGLSHSALRQIIHGFGGVGLLATEMLPARKLPTQNPQFSPSLIRTDLEKPLSYQLLVAAPDQVAPAIEALHRLKADAIDFNMGCPSSKVTRFGGGSILMENLREVRRIIAVARKQTTLPLTAKIRLGPKLDQSKLKDFCAMLEDEGIDLLTVHARLSKEPFGRKPRWSWCARIKEWLTIPLVINGGIFCSRDGERCLRESRADGLMLGRGAVSKPWLFSEIARDLYGCKIPKKQVSLPAVYNNFINLLVTQFPVDRRLGRLKDFTHYFAANFTFGHHLALSVQNSRSVEEAKEKAGLFFEKEAAKETEARVLFQPCT
ncbi:MAG: tRNA-dihydrouridine synthase family protein [Deltaproteobacteria bacterium]|nr:tRNA-dihydrouridine synthase family protein [Deltaproteobacteria bacterium]